MIKREEQYTKELFDWQTEKFQIHMQRRSDVICCQITRLISSETVLLSNEPVTEGSTDFSKVKQSDTL